MEKTFEMRMNDLQSNIVSVCMEYCDNICDQLYIHIINENNTLFADFFYRINGDMLKKSKICANESIVSPKRQQVVLSEVVSNSRKLLKLYDEHGQSQPTEIKFIYDNKQGGELMVEYKYDKVTTEKISDRYLSQKWFEELQG